MKTSPKTTTPARTLDRLEIRPIESRYTGGNYAEVRALITFAFAGAGRGLVHERNALATGHRLVAAALDAMPASERWIVSVEVSASYRNVVALAVRVELADGGPAEMERAKQFLTTQTAALA